MTGDVTDQETLRAVIKGKDAVIQSLGIGGRGNGAPMTCVSETSRLIIAAMKAEGVKRLIAISAIEADDSWTYLLWIYRSFVLPVFQKWFVPIIDDKNRMETDIENSGLDWTIIRLTTVKDTRPRRDVNASLDGKGLKFSISASDMGHFVAAQLISAGRLPEGQSAKEQLLRLGYMPSDLDYVVLSHLDVDHVSGLRDVSEAKNLLVSRPELEAASRLKNRIRYWPDLWKGLPLQPFDFSDTGIGPFGKSYDLFDDGSVQLVDIAGHTQGLCGMLVSKGGKYVLMFADGGYSSRSWQEMILPGPYSDKPDLRRSLEWIREMSISDSCLASWATHDPNLTPQTIIL